MELNRKFKQEGQRGKEEIPDKYFLKCSTREMQTKTTLKFLLTQELLFFLKKCQKKLVWIWGKGHGYPLSVGA